MTTTKQLKGIFSRSLRALFATALAVGLAVQPANARKMSAMEWMDPTSMSIWKELSDSEKDESLNVVLFSDPSKQGAGMAGMGAAMMAMPGAMAGIDSEKDLSDAEKKEKIAKIKACLNKEVADPDYNGVQVALMMPMWSCGIKYGAIEDAKKRK